MNKIIHNLNDNWRTADGYAIGFVYAVRLLGAGNKIYIGTSKDPYIRFHSHVNALKGNRHICQQMQDDYNAYGGEIQVDILEAAPLCRIRLYELYWQIKLKSYLSENGYNGQDPQILRLSNKKPTKRFLELTAENADVAEILGIPKESDRMVAGDSKYLFSIISYEDDIFKRRTYKYVTFRKESVKKVHGMRWIL